MNEQEILDNAPEGATHCTDTVPSMNLYAKVEHLGGFYVSLGNKWERYPIYAGIHLLDDLRRIVELESGLNLCKEFLELMHQMDTNWTIKESIALRKIVIERLKGGE